MIALVYLPFVLIGLLLFYNFYLKRRGIIFMINNP